MKTLPKLLPFTLAALFALSACGNDETDTQQKETDFVKVEAPKEEGAVNMLLPDFAQLVAQEGGSVVNIRAIIKPEHDDSSLLKELFGQWNDIPETDENTDNFGSGVIISRDGFILTNAHVVKNAEQIKVTFTDRREFVAKLIGSDEKSDIALLKIEANDLPLAKIGNSDELKSGEWVAAIGAPFGFENSVTAGIVSAKGRNLPDENYTPFIQTDVAINPGNSGGPLFNLKGEVVGINSQIYSQNGGFMGISFSIPIEVAMNVAEQLKQYGTVHRGQLGIIIQEVNYDLAQAFGLDKPQGALVSRILPNSPAQKAGLQNGDIILSADGQNIQSSHDLPIIIGSTSPGKEIVLKVWRKKQTIDLTVKLIALNEQLTQLPDHNIVPPSSRQNGFIIPKLDLTLNTQLIDGQSYLTVQEAAGIAALNGLKRGDIIIEFNSQAVKDKDSFLALLEQSQRLVPVLVQRNGNMLFLTLTLPE